MAHWVRPVCMAHWVRQGHMAQAQPHHGLQYTAAQQYACLCFFSTTAMRVHTLAHVHTAKRMRTA
eukprot:170376-Chlamydomonas_euryale.AAC.1